MCDGAFHPNSVSDSTVFTVAMTSRGFVDFERRDVGFIVVAVMIFFSLFVECLGLFNGHCNLFKFSIHMFL